MWLNYMPKIYHDNETMIMKAMCSEAPYSYNS